MWIHGAKGNGKRVAQAALVAPLTAPLAFFLATVCYHLQTGSADLIRNVTVADVGENLLGFTMLTLPYGYAGMLLAIPIYFGLSGLKLGGLIPVVAVGVSLSQLPLSYLSVGLFDRWRFLFLVPGIVVSATAWFMVNRGTIRQEPSAPSSGADLTMKTGASGVSILFWVILMLPGIACGQQAVVPNATEPSPDLTPEQVIAIQLNALKNNDRPSPDHGIGITFNFASPGNKASTGPLARFIQMVKNPVYRPMLNHRSYSREAIETFGDVARQRVTLVDAGGKRHVYIFILSKQTEPPYEDSWMTDSVMRVVDESGPTRVA